jgi:hypothetical protein
VHEVAVRVAPAQLAPRQFGGQKAIEAVAASVSPMRGPRPTSQSPSNVATSTRTTTSSPRSGTANSRVTAVLFVARATSRQVPGASRSTRTSPRRRTTVAGCGVMRHEPPAVMLSGSVGSTGSVGHAVNASSIVSA